MLRIRLRRVGAKKQPSYRIVVAESTAPRDGKFVESIGFYNPRTEPETVRIDEERALHWLSVGAQPSDAVARIFRTHGTMARFERFRAGESLQSLLAEAEEAAEEAVEEPQAEPEEAEAVEAARAESEEGEPEVVEVPAAELAEPEEEAEPVEAESVEAEAVVEEPKTEPEETEEPEEA